MDYFESKRNPLKGVKQESDRIGFYHFKRSLWVASGEWAEGGVGMEAALWGFCTSPDINNVFGGGGGGQWRKGKGSPLDTYFRSRTEESFQWVDQICGLCFLQKVLRWFLELVQRILDEDGWWNVSNESRLRPMIMDSTFGAGRPPVTEASEIWFHWLLDVQFTMW